MFYFRSPKRRSVVNLGYRLDPDTTGKWVVFGKRSYIGKLWKITREYVNEGKLYEVKFTKSSIKGKYALLVYADKDTKTDFYNILGELNLNPRWISNEKTRRNFKRKRKNLINRLTSGF